MNKWMEWVEIPANDFQRAVHFYENLLNTSLTDVSDGDEKMACFSTGEGAIVQAREATPGARGVVVSLRVPQMEQALKQLTQLGGKIVKGKTKIEAEGRGYFALFQDTEGNQLGLYAEN